MKRNALLCPNCRKLISADEVKCPHCGTARPGAWWKNNRIIRRLYDPGEVLKLIIGVNVVMFLLSLLIHPKTTSWSLNPFHFLTPGSDSLLLFGATGTFPIDRLHRWWTLLSANYLHGGLLHILFNMLALNHVGALTIREYGLSRTFIVYTVGGVLGFLVSYLAGIRFTIGASAALCALLGALLYFGKSRGGIYGQAVYKHIGGWIIGLFLIGIGLPGINNWGHGGGLVAGILLGISLGYREKRRENRVDKALAGVCLTATAAVLVWAAATGFYYRFQS